jgi:hypothetical protein
VLKLIGALVDWLMSDTVTDPLAPLPGAITIWYVPVTGSIFPKELNWLLPLPDARVIPFGATREELNDPPPKPAASKLTICWYVPANVSRTFWPGTLMVDVTGGPPTVMVPVTSGASYRFTVTVPVEDPAGTKRIAYVPVIGRLRLPSNPLLPIQLFDPRDAPVGLRTEIVRLQDPNVPPVVVTLTLLPCVPSNTKRPILEAVVSAMLV